MFKGHHPYFGQLIAAAYLQLGKVPAHWEADVDTSIVLPKGEQA